MTRQELMADAHDLCAERNRVWSDAESMAVRICNSNFSSEILADFIADLACGNGLDNCDPLQLLKAHAVRWDYDLEESESFDLLEDEEFV